MKKNIKEGCPFRYRLKNGRKPRIAAFDLDDTLISGDSQLEFFGWLARRGLVDEAVYERAKSMMADYAAGRLDMRAYVREAAPVLNVVSRERLDLLLVEFVEEMIVPSIYPQGRKTIESARAAGLDVVLISATMAPIVRAVGTRIGFDEDEMIGVELQEKDGRFTGEIRGVPSFREGKITRLAAWIAGRNARHLRGRQALLKDAVFFSDSRNDLSLLRRAGGAVMVNPDEVLKEEGKAQGWVMLGWTS